MSSAAAEMYRQSIVVKRVPFDLVLTQGVEDDNYANFHIYMEFKGEVFKLWDLVLDKGRVKTYNEESEKEEAHPGQVRVNTRAGRANIVVEDKFAEWIPDRFVSDITSILFPRTDIITINHNLLADGRARQFVIDGLDKIAVGRILSM